MKIFQYVLLFIFILLIFILQTKISFLIHFDGNIRFTLKIYFLKYKLCFPILYKDKESDDEEKYVYQTEHVTSTKKSKRKKEKLPFSGIKNSVTFFANSAKEVFGKVVHYFRLEKFIFKAIAASDDAAKTAELYGVFCTAGAILHQFATNARGIKKNSVYIEIIPDFCAQSSDVFSDIIFSIRFWRLSLILTKILSLWNKYKKLALQAQKDYAKKENLESENQK